MIWMQLAEPVTPPYMAVFRLILETKKRRTIEFDYSADEYVRLFLDGEHLAEGPAPGSPERWNLSSCRVELDAGRHVLTARLSVFGEMRSAHCMTVRPGFYTTLPGNWEVKQVDDCGYSAPWPDWGSVPRVHVGTGYAPEILEGKGEGWEPVEYFSDDRPVFRPELPQQLYLPETGYRREGNFFHFDDYVCVWPEYRFSGKGRVRLRWAESPYLLPVLSNHSLKGEKGRRDGTYFFGNYDEFEVAGKELRWFDLQWRAGRWLEVECTGSAKLEEVHFYRTGYPYPSLAEPSGLPEKFRGLYRMAKRTLECCSHEMLIDCPFYERMQYAGDARIEALCAYAAFGEWRLPLHVLRQLASSQQEDGSLYARYPAKVTQVIPAFVINYIMMLYDFALWNPGKKEEILELLPSARKAAEYLNNHRKDGLLYLPGWNFIDWQWPNRGVPYGSEAGTHSILNLLGSLAFRNLAELEKFTGAPELENKYRDRSEDLYRNVVTHYFNEKTGAFADDFNHHFYSEHAQVLAYILHPDDRLISFLKSGRRVTQCGIFFSFYYFEMCYLAGETELFNKRLEVYREYENMGLKTLPEDFLQPRSDCHAWSAHFLYHYHASILGKRPVRPGEGLRTLPMETGKAHLAFY